MPVPLDDLPILSIVVAFKGDERCVLDCLSSILAGDYPMERLDVIAVDDLHDDALADQIRKLFPVVRLIRNSTQLGCDGAKQRGIEAASGDVIALTDADCTVHPMWLRVIAKNFAAGASVVTGPVRHPKTFLRELVAVSDFRDFQGERNRWIDSFPGCNVAARRECLKSARYNRSGRVRGGSDRLISWQLHTGGRRITYDPAMIVYHTPAVDVTSLLQRRMMYGRTALAMRMLDPSLPGSVLARVGPFAAPAYMCYKIVKDSYCLVSMTARRLVNPWHIPLLLPALLLFRVLDGVGMMSMGKLDGEALQSPGPQWH